MLPRSVKFLLWFAAITGVALLIAMVYYTRIHTTTRRWAEDVRSAIAVGMPVADVYGTIDAAGGQVYRAPACTTAPVSQSCTTIEARFTRRTGVVASFEIRVADGRVTSVGNVGSW